MSKGNGNGRKHLNSDFRTPVKRTNEYDIFTPHQPRQTNSVPIDQDGTEFSYLLAIYLEQAVRPCICSSILEFANTGVLVDADCTSRTSKQCATHNTFKATDYVLHSMLPILTLI